MATDKSFMHCISFARSADEMELSKYTLIASPVGSLGSSSAILVIVLTGIIPDSHLRFMPVFISCDLCSYKFYVPNEWFFVRFGNSL